MIAKIYQLFFQELIRYVTKMTCDKAAAEDIVQETFLRAMEHAETLDDMDERQCRSWLYKTSRNIFIDKVRRESACPEAEEKTETQDDLSQIEVRQLCEKLPEEERILFIKRYFEGFDSTQLSRPCTSCRPPPFAHALPAPGGSCACITPNWKIKKNKRCNYGKNEKTVSKYGSL